MGVILRKSKLFRKKKKEPGLHVFVMGANPA
jgi:hypothetical protein